MSVSDLAWCHLQGADSDTALHLSALYGHADCVRLLLDSGARAEVADADGALPLHDAAGE
jgi:ankyrin repeat protein